VRQFLDENDVLQENRDITFIVAECDGVSYIKEQNNGEKKGIAAVCEDNKWEVTGKASDDPLALQMNENLSIRVEEQMLSGNSVVAVYDQNLNLIEKIKEKQR